MDSPEDVPSSDTEISKWRLSVLFLTTSTTRISIHTLNSEVPMFGDDAYMVSSIISNRETIGKTESSYKDVGGSLMPMLNAITLLNNPSL
jgi:hypothetical protein